MSLLRNFPKQVLPPTPVGVRFFESQPKDTIIDVKDIDGNIIAQRKSREVVRRPVLDSESVRTDIAEMYTIDMMLQTGVNQESVTRPYFIRSLDDATAMFSLLNRDGLVELSSESTPEPTPETTPETIPSK